VGRQVELSIALEIRYFGEQLAAVAEHPGAKVFGGPEV
jgi:hypothetical protein